MTLPRNGFNKDRTEFVLTVYGDPIPQGSKRLVRDKRGNTRMLEANAKHANWRDTVTWAARASFERGYGFETQPLMLHATFSFSRMNPKTGRINSGAAKRRYPHVKPDLSKLIRSVEDSLTDARVWPDDSLVVQVTAKKVYCCDQGALDNPGVSVLVQTMPEDL